MAVPNIFATATSSIPLSQLDTNFATAITLGSTALYLGNTTTSVAGLTITGGAFNGTVGATTPSTGAFTTGTFSSTLAVTGITTVAAGTELLPAIVSTTGTADTGLWFPAADTIAASTAGTERMRITSAGLVGIGTQTPGYKLEVKGASATAGQLSIHDGTGDTTVSGVTAASLLFQARDTSIRTLAEIDAVNTTTNGTGGAMVFQTRVSDTLAERMRIDSTGLVGIGTNAPNVNLEVYNATSVAQRLTAGSNIFEFINNSTENRISAIAALPLTFRTSNTEYMRIDSSGNVEIGITTAAPAKFTVSGQGGSNVWVQNNINTGTSAIVSLGFSNANGLVGYVQTSGSATSYVTSSDYRLKQHIQPMIGALAKVAQLKPVTYKWKVDGSNGQGFIAHELQEVVPDCVSGEKDATREEEYEVIPAVPAVVDAEGVETTPAVQAVKGTRIVPSYQGVDTSFLVATLTAAIQELKAIIDTQATRITALEAR